MAKMNVVPSLRTWIISSDPVRGEEREEERENMTEDDLLSSELRGRACGAVEEEKKKRRRRTEGVMLDQWMDDRYRGGQTVKRWRGGFVYFFAHWHAAAKAGRQADDFSDEGFESQILLQHDAPQDGLQLRNTRTWRRKRREMRGWNYGSPERLCFFLFYCRFPLLKTDYKTISFL